jgi:hypothetical protein
MMTTTKHVELRRVSMVLLITHCIPVNDLFRILLDGPIV